LIIIPISDIEEGMVRYTLPRHYGWSIITCLGVTHNTWIVYCIFGTC